jgi:hypothetical protein
MARRPGVLDPRPRGRSRAGIDAADAKPIRDPLGCFMSAAPPASPPSSSVHVIIDTTPLVGT